jgi:hypothetical protein
MDAIAGSGSPTRSSFGPRPLNFQSTAKIQNRPFKTKIDRSFRNDRHRRRDNRPRQKSASGAVGNVRRQDQHRQPRRRGVQRMSSAVSPMASARHPVAPKWRSSVDADFQARPSGTPFGRTGVIFSASPQRGVIRNISTGSQKRRATAYGVVRDSIAEGGAERSQVRHSSQLSLKWKAWLMKKA